MMMAPVESVKGVMKAPPNKVRLPRTSRVEEGEVVPMPTRLLVVSTSKKLLILKAVVEEPRVRLAEPEVEVSVSAPVVRINPLSRVNPEEKRPVPLTCKVEEGVIILVPMPNLPFTLSQIREVLD